jgi:excisionase family DNA binding protein
MSQPDILTVAEAAQLLRLPENTIIAMCRRKELKAQKLGGEWRISGPHVAELVDRIHKGGR